MERPRDARAAAADSGGGDTRQRMAAIPEGGEDELRAWLAAIVDSSDDAIVSKTLDGVITSWNRGAERIFGYSAAEAIGRPITLIIPDDCRAEEEEVLARLRRGEQVPGARPSRAGTGRALALGALGFLALAILAAVPLVKVARREARIGLAILGMVGAAWCAVLNGPELLEPLDGYIAALRPDDRSPARLPPGGAEPVGAAAATSESLILGLRTDRGVPSSALRGPRSVVVRWALAESLLTIDSDRRARLTTRGRLLSNEIFQRLI